MAPIHPVPEVEGSSTWRRHGLSQMDAQCLMLKGVTTVAFYRGDPTGAHKALRARMGLVLAQNPWLAAHLIKVKGMKRPQLFFPPVVDGEQTSKALVHLAEPSALLRYGCTYGELHRAINGTALEVCEGSKLVNKNVPIVSVTVVPEAAGGDAGGDTGGDAGAGPGPGASEGAFAVVVSLSHTVCDGHTFTAVKNMLREGEPVVALDPSRPAGPDVVTQRFRRAFGADACEYLMGPGVLFNFIFKALTQRKHLSIRVVHKGTVAQAKANEEGLVEYVSTNDVITSDFFKLCGCRNGHMAVNTRGRVEGCGEKDSSNLEFAIMYNPADFASPSLIRKSIARLRRAAEPLTRFPWWIRRPFCRLALCTSWATNAKEVTIPGCEHRLNLPYLDPGFIPCEACIVFRPRDGETAALTFTTIDMDKLDIFSRGCFGDRLVGISATLK